jgi:hypothetical protein
MDAQTQLERDSDIAFAVSRQRDPHPACGDAVLEQHSQKFSDHVTRESRKRNM